MTDDQILAMAAKDAPEVAKAFQEKFKAMDAASQQKFMNACLLIGINLPRSCEKQSWTCLRLPWRPLVHRGNPV